MTDPTYVVLGAGVVGLTTALELRSRYPTAVITIVAKHLPGTSSIEYTSPHAGANWLSVAIDNGRQEEWDAITYRRFGELADHVPEAGVRRMDLRAFYDSPMEEAGLLSRGTGKVWYEELTGLRKVPQDEMPEGARVGLDMSTYIINVQIYLPW